jgi:hypothetical protein
MGDNSIFIVFSNIWSSLRLKIPFNFKLLGNTDCLPWIWAVKQMINFPFVFLYLIAANKGVLVLYACVHKISLKYLFPEKICHQNMSGV